jgi:hypothetical protein
VLCTLKTPKFVVIVNTEKNQILLKIKYDQVLYSKKMFGLEIISTVSWAKMTNL